MDQQPVLAPLVDKSRLDLATSLAFTSNTITNSSAQLCITTTQSTSTSQSPTLDPSRMTVQPVKGIFVKQEFFEEESSALSHQQVITAQIPPHRIIETVEYNPNIAIKLEQFDDDTTLSNQQTEDSSNNEQTETLQVARSVKSEYHSPQNQYNILNSVKVEVKKEYSDCEYGGCTQCALKRKLDFEGSEQMETFHHQQVTEDPTNFVHFVPDQVPPHQIIETVQYNPNITIKQEQFDDDTTLSNGPSHTEYSSTIAIIRSTSSSNEHNFVTVKEELKEEYCPDELCNECGMKREFDCEEVDTGRLTKRQRSEHMNDEYGLIQEDEEFGHNEGDQQGGDAEPAGNDQVNEGGQVIQHRVDQVVETENNFKCTFPRCGKEFKHKSYFTRHTRMHTGEKPFKCTWNECDKAFAQNCHLKEHFRVHSGDKPFKCSWNGCDKAFTESSGFRAHLRVHTREKPFKCFWNGCGKTFARWSALHRHKRVHTGERPFPCDWPNCGVMFTRKEYLTKHYNRIHNRK